MTNDKRTALAMNMTKMLISGKGDAVKLLTDAGYTDAQAQVDYYRLFLIKQGKIKVSGIRNTKIRKDLTTEDIRSNLEE